MVTNNDNRRGLTGRVWRFLSLSAAERMAIVKMAFVLSMIQIGLRWVGFKVVHRVLSGWPIGSAVPEEAEVREISFNIRHLMSAQRNLPFTGKCLARSLALWWFLKRRGIKTSLRFGICKDEGRFLSHAWIEYQGRPLIDGE